ncbi:MAG: DMT family transporter, partial [Planctomycetes bacterium]|nr:DMT family transporter [Planctomycetota bacterium]
VLVVASSSRPGPAGSAPALGYAICAAGAVTWTCYSLLTKRLAAFPTAAVGGFCLSSGAILLAMHAVVVRVGADAEALASAGGWLALVVAPLNGLDRWEWILILLCGLGPMGAAYFTWDAAMKRGDPRVIGSLAFLTPLASTLILAGVGGHTLGWSPLVALVLIIGGAVIGSLDLFSRPDRV